MIRVGPNYGITADEHGYVLSRIRVAKDGTKTAEKNETGEYPSFISSHPNVYGCIKYIIRNMCRNLVSEKEEISLSEAARAFKEIETQVYEWAKIDRDQKDGD